MTKVEGSGAEAARMIRSPVVTVLGARAPCGGCPSASEDDWGAGAHAEMSTRARPTKHTRKLAISHSLLRLTALFPRLARWREGRILAGSIGYLGLRMTGARNV